MDESLLRGLNDDCTPLDRQLTLQYFEHLQSTNDAWKLCMSHFTERVNSDDRVLFFCLQVLEHHVKTRHASSSDEDICQLRKIVLTWFEPSSDTQRLKTFIKNKMAQIVSLIFITDYPLKWPNFFIEILSLLDQYYTMSTLDMYLRTLLAIDSEIVDREIIHSQEENVRNTIIKDHIRDTCVLQLVESWLNILSSYESFDHEVLSLTMSVIGSYVTWIDITLIANDKFVRFLLNFLSVPLLRESAADCLHDIINKGMEPLSKLELVESLVKLLEGTGILTSAEVDDDDVDFQSKMSQLVNGMGVALITAYQKLLKAGDVINAQLVLDSVNAKIPYLLRYLLDEDDGVSENMIGFATQYLVVLKHLTNFSDDYRQSLQTLLLGVVNKLKYDEGYNFLSPGEEEGLFMEYRAKLHVVFDNIAQVDAALVMSTVQSLLTQSICNINQESFISVEVSLLVFYFVSESGFEKMFGTAATNGTPFHDMMQLLMDSQLSYHKHSAVLLQYYEAILRQEKFFSTSPQYIPQVMEGFLDHRGLRHANPAVRSRLSYQFLRFVKSSKAHLAEIAEEVLERMRDILLNILELYGTHSLLTANDTMFLYEAAGYLVVYSASTPDKKYKLMKSILTPLMEKFSHYITELCSTYIPQLQDDISQLLHYILSYASRTSKVFPNHQLAQQSGCVPCFNEALSIVLQGLQVTIYRERLQSGVRQYLHRMIICLGDELLKFIPLAVSLLLGDAESHDIQEFIPLINQLISKYKGRIAPFLQEVFVPIVQTIITCSNKPFDPLDTEECRDRLNLQKSYFLFINSLCSNEVTDVISNQGNEHLQDVLKTIVDGAKTSPDPSVKRLCFMSLKKLVECWCGENQVDGFIDFAYKEILPLCFLVPFDNSFDLNEAQSYLCLGEIACVIKTLIYIGGNSFLLYLQNQYLPSLHIHPDVIQELLVKLQETDTKTLKPYLKEFFKNLRTHSALVQ